MATCTAVAEWITATAAVVGLALILVLRRYDQDCKRRDILVEFMRTDYNLDLEDGRLFQMWHQIESHWCKSGIVEIITTLREGISEFRALPNWNIVLVIERSYALDKLNEARSQLCKQMHDNTMCFLRPGLKEIVPFGRTRGRVL